MHGTKTGVQKRNCSRICKLDEVSQTSSPHWLGVADWELVFYMVYTLVMVSGVPCTLVGGERSRMLPTFPENVGFSLKVLSRS